MPPPVSHLLLALNMQQSRSTGLLTKRKAFLLEEGQTCKEVLLSIPQKPRLVGKRRWKVRGEKAIQKHLKNSKQRLSVSASTDYKITFGQLLVQWFWFPWCPKRPSSEKDTLSSIIILSSGQSSMEGGGKQTNKQQKTKPKPTNSTTLMDSA